MVQAANQQHGGNGGRALSRLSPKQIDAWVKARSPEPSTKLADGGGLYLVRLPSRTCAWWIRYRYRDGSGAIRDRTYSAGTYPATSLAEARAEREKVKGVLKTGREPVQLRRLDRAAEVASSNATFASVAEEWLRKEEAAWSQVHAKKARRAIERDVLPVLGKLPVRDITPAIVANMIESIQSRGVRETAMKILQHVRSIFRYATARGLRTDNPAGAAIEVIRRPEPKQHHPALLTFEELGDVLRRGDLAPISPAVRLCHRLIAFTATRISNAVAACWDDFDLDSSPATWIIPRAQLKVRGRAHDHKVILAPPIAEELRRWRDAHAERGVYVFPGTQGRVHLSREAVEKALRETLDLEGKHSPHGWRSSFSTLAKDHGFDKPVVDLALDHVHDTEVARAYDRGERMKQRVTLAAWWAKQLRSAQRRAGAPALPSA
jgi:integrase